jgi:hypothetical protein
MKHFYGYKRAEKDAPNDIAEKWLDDATTARQERHDMMLAIARDNDRPDGDDVYVLALGDLGHGAEAAAMREAIKSEGARLHIIKADAVPETRGRPAIFDPDDAKDKKIRTLYRSYNQMKYVLARVNAIYNKFLPASEVIEIKAHHLKRKYGNRWPKSKEQDNG